MHLKSLQIWIITDCLSYLWEDRYQNGPTSGFSWHISHLISLFLAWVMSTNIILFIIEHPVEPWCGFCSSSCDRGKQIQLLLQLPEVQVVLVMQVWIGVWQYHFKKFWVLKTSVQDKISLKNWWLLKNAC